MDSRTELGRNRTGVQTSPIDSARMTDAEDALRVDETAPREDRQVRLDYIAGGDKLGSVPVPATLTGVAKSGVDMLTGKRPQVLMDKLGERLAFERGGVRLYDALLLKCRGADTGLSDQDEALLETFRRQEAEHMETVAQALRDLGGDPTAQTPCAGLVGVESQGLVQAMNDPRISFVQSLHVMLDAELIDNASWEMLAELARNAGHPQVAERFDTPLRQEAVHLQTLREWVGRLTLADAGAADRLM